jgi:hypothetical protein
VTNVVKDPLHDLDFDSWARLAKDDPESFEATRRAAIEGLIQSFPDESRERMRRLQWRIDQERRLAKSPMGACVRLSRMMWRQLLGEGGLRDRLAGLADDLRPGDGPVTTATPPRNARVLTFVRPGD